MRPVFCFVLEGWGEEGGLVVIICRWGTSRTNNVLCTIPPVGNDDHPDCDLEGSTCLFHPAFAWASTLRCSFRAPRVARDRAFGNNSA